MRSSSCSSPRMASSSPATCCATCSHSISAPSLIEAATDGLFDRRRSIRGPVAGERVGRPALCPPYLIADTIEERLTQVGLERAVVPRLERAEPLDDLRERVLN